MKGQPKANPSSRKQEKQVRKAQEEQLNVNRKSRVIGLFLALLGMAVYLNSIGNGYVLDDFSVIKENNIVSQGTSALGTIWKTTYRQGYLNVQDGLYRPFTLSVFALEWQIKPNSPGLAHFINIVIYGLGIFLLFGVLSFALRNGKEWVAVAATALFAVHPIHTEVVGNIKSLDELLCFAGCMALLWRELRGKNKGSQLALNLSLFLLALFSKESAVMWLGILPLSLWFFTDAKMPEIIKRTVWYAIPFALFMFIRLRVVGKAGDLETVSLADNLLMAAKNPAERLGTIMLVLGQYLRLMIFPDVLLYNYSYNQIPVQSLFSPLPLVLALGHLAAFVWALLQARTKNLLAYAVLFYLGCLFMFSNLAFTIGAAMGERFAFFSSAGFCLLVALVLSKWDNKPASTSWLPGTVAVRAVFILVLVAGAGRTWARNTDWKDNLTLYEHDLPASENSTRSHYYLGNELSKTYLEPIQDTAEKRKMANRVAGHLQKALEIYPEYLDAMTQLGVTYYKINDFKKAGYYYEMVLSRNPNDALAINNLAAIYFQIQRYPDAIKRYQQAVALNPRFDDAWVNMGSCYGMLQQYQESINAFQQAVAVNPNNPKAWLFMGLSYGNMGNPAMKAECFQKARQIDPSVSLPPQ
jgi:tetratricopeptide (TPR) repeat protein